MRENEENNSKVSKTCIPEVIFVKGKTVILKI